MILRKILLSPLLHFFVLGASIFAAFAILDDTPDVPPPDAITLSVPEATRLARQFEATWNRPPTPDELRGMMRSWALEEANVREALMLGLDRGDAVIRQRLNLKMQFLAESGAAAEAPVDATLQSYLDGNPERFIRPAEIAFDQVILTPDEAGDADRVRAALDAGTDPSTLGAASLLPARFPLTPAPIVDRTFGTGFHAALADLPPGSWEGPVTSGYGRHLVRVTDRADAVLAPLSEIRDQVEVEWRAARTRALREEFNRALLERHTVTLPDAEEVLGR